MTAYEIPGQRITAKLKAATDKGIGVTIGTDGLAVIAGADSIIAGVTMMPGVADENVSIMLNGVAMGVLGDVVATGAKVSMDAEGKFVTTIAGPVVGICAFGGADGAYGSIILK